MQSTVVWSSSRIDGELELQLEGFPGDGCAKIDVDVSTGPVEFRLDIVDGDMTNVSFGIGIASEDITSSAGRRRLCNGVCRTGDNFDFAGIGTYLQSYRRMDLPMNTVSKSYNNYFVGDHPKKFVFGLDPIESTFSIRFSDLFDLSGKLIWKLPIVRIVNGVYLLLMNFGSATAVRVRIGSE